MKSKITKESRNLLIGMLLGDGTISNNNVFKIAHSESQKEYLELKVKQLKDAGIRNNGIKSYIKIKGYKTGKTLVKLRSEFKGTDSEYADYLAKHQGGIAYYEAFVPIYANELFTKFADKDGNIDIDTIEQINPDLLKAIGYRIPTEDKYSAMPLRIYGFMPAISGTTIMLPSDIITMSGTDFKQYWSH